MNDNDLLKQLLTPLVNFAHTAPAPTQEQIKEKTETKVTQKETTKTDKKPTKKRKASTPSTDEKPKKIIKKTKKKQSVSFDTFI